MSSIRFRDNNIGHGSSGMRQPGRNSRGRRERLRLPASMPLSNITPRHLFDRDDVLAWYDAKRRQKGNGAGVDGIRLDEFHRHDMAIVCGEIIDAIHTGTFVPNELREVGHRRRDGRIRLLNVPVVCERIVLGAAADMLASPIGQHIGSNIYGVTPGQGTDGMLLDIIRVINTTPEDQGIFFCERDIARAFDRVRHEAVWSALRQLGFSEALIETLRRIMRPSAGQNENVGLSQGNPFSPMLFGITLASCLNLHNNQEETVGVLTPRVYIDNIEYISTQERLISSSIDRHLAALATAGLEYGASGDTIANLREGDAAKILGYTISFRANKARLEIRPERIAEAKATLQEATATANPAETARVFLNGYVAGHGIVYATAGRDYCRFVLEALCADIGLEGTEFERTLDLWERKGRRLLNLHSFLTQCT